MDKKTEGKGRSWQCKVLDGLFEVGIGFFITLFGVCLLAVIILLATQIF